MLHAVLPLKKGQTWNKIESRKN